MFLQTWCFRTSFLTPSKHGPDLCSIFRPLVVGLLNFFLACNKKNRGMFALRKGFLWRKDWIDIVVWRINRQKWRNALKHAVRILEGNILISVSVTLRIFVELGFSHREPWMLHYAYSEVWLEIFRLIVLKFGRQRSLLYCLKSLSLGAKGTARCTETEKYFLR